MISLESIGKPLLSCLKNENHDPIFDWVQGLCIDTLGNYQDAEMPMGVLDMTSYLPQRPDHTNHVKDELGAAMIERDAKLSLLVGGSFESFNDFSSAAQALEQEWDREENEIDEENDSEQETRASQLVPLLHSIHEKQATRLSIAHSQESNTVEALLSLSQGFSTQTPKVNRKLPMDGGDRSAKRPRKSGF